MALPFYCKSCDSLLASVNMETTLMFCEKCHRPSELPENDKTVLVIANDSARSRGLTSAELSRLSGLPTTNAIKENCTKCDSPILNQVYDTDYKFYCICPKCKYVFNRSTKN
jgi:DNA-directed RNA polymerase subunit M/transcription elongation factor TFIIS